ncbi:MAG: hypothetical protein K0S12_907 [Bacteroidetes bacterium]|nr:hypothetical protein [Bacteroidota bacterium]
MNKLFLLTSGLVAVTLVACTSYAKTLEKSEISQKQTEIAKNRWSESNLQALANGKQIYTQKCTECHKAFVIEKFSEKKWNHEIDDMSPKAKLTPEEKQHLTYFLLSYREMKAGK